MRPTVCLRVLLRNVLRDFSGHSLSRSMFENSSEEHCEGGRSRLAGTPDKFLEWAGSRAVSLLDRLVTLQPLLRGARMLVLLAGEAGRQMFLRVGCMTSLLEPFEVLTAARQSVGLARKPDGVDLELVAELVRRTAGLECPCSSASIVEHVVQCLYGLVDAELARRHVQEALDELVSAGDLLELEKVTTVDERARGSWLFIAPPTFVELPSGVIRILGMAAEETLPLPASLKELVERSGTRRTIPRVNDDIVPVLSAAGFRQLSVDAWLKAPAPFQRRSI